MTLEAAALAGLLARGINFDHLFDPYRDPKEPWTAQAQADIAKAIQPKEFQQVAALGFTHVRLNLGQVFLQESATPYAMRPEGLALLDRALDGIAAAKLGVVLDMHQIPVPDLAGSPAARAAFTALWRALAGRYRTRPQPIVFELLNEPRVEDAGVWRGVVTALIGEIRAADPDRWIIVTGGGWGDGEDTMKLGKLALPRLIYSFHFYEPFIFTHQGADWSDPVMAPLRGIRYPIDPAQVREARAKAVAAHQETWPFDDAARAGTAEAIERRLAPIFAWGKQEGVPLYCGEFGVHKPVAPPADRARWLADMTTILDRHGILRAMWAYHAGFDLVEKNGTPTSAVVRALGLTPPR